MSFKKSKITVNGSPVKIDIDAELEIDDISDDMDKVAAQIAYWGAVWASAEQEAAAADAYYRAWRASEGRKIAKKNDKLAEWKVRQILESRDEFSQIKQGMANAAQNVILAKTMCEAFKTKASMLQSKGAMMRAELDSTSMRTPSGRQEAKEKKRAEGKATMKKIFKAKKKK